MKKIETNFFAKNKRDVYFILIGIALSVMVIWIFISVINFLVKNVNLALRFEEAGQNVVRFKINSLKSLGINISDQSNSTTSP